MKTDPGIATVGGRSRSGFHQLGRRCLHQVQSAVRCSASRTKGELHPTKKPGGGREGEKHVTEKVRWSTTITQSCAAV